MSEVKLLDADGENRAMQLLVGMLQWGKKQDVRLMKLHFQEARLHGCWPDCLNEITEATSYLTAENAQEWLRHIFLLELQEKSGSPIAWLVEAWNDDYASRSYGYFDKLEKAKAALDTSPAVFTKMTELFGGPQVPLANSEQEKTLSDGWNDALRQASIAEVDLEIANARIAELEAQITQNPIADRKPDAYMHKLDERAVVPAWVKEKLPEEHENYNISLYRGFTIDKVERQSSQSDPAIPYSLALDAIEQMLHAAASKVEDHERDRYSITDTTRPQDVAPIWAKEVLEMDAESYLKASIKYAPNK